MSNQNLAAPEGRLYVKVWDKVVRLGHWTMVLCFAALYLRSSKFPLHVYAAYILMSIMLFRIIWGFVGTHAARFSSFIYGPKAMIEYGVQSVVGHPKHTISHNPLGAAMVFALILIMIGNGVLGMMLYSAGQEMGFLGDMVPSEWEDELTAFNLFGQTVTVGLKDLHILLGNLAAVLVVSHVLGTIWAGAVHKTNHVISMITGVKDVEKTDPELVHYEQVATPRFAKQLDDSVGPAMGQIILAAGIVACFIWPLVEILGYLNKFIPSY